MEPARVYTTDIKQRIATRGTMKCFPSPCATNAATWKKTAFATAPIRPEVAR